MNQGAKTPASIGRVFFVVIFTLSVLALAYLTGQWHPRMDGRITEVHICDSDVDYVPATKFSFTTKQLYICGTVEGTNFTRANFHLWCNSNSIFNDYRRLDIGNFFIPLPQTGHSNYEQGDCRVTVQYDRIVAHEVNFSIVKP